MTTMCTLFGFLPLALAVGEGAEVRSPMAITVIGGLLVSTLLTLVVIPVVYDLPDRRGDDHYRARARHADADLRAAQDAISADRGLAREMRRLAAGTACGRPCVSRCRLYRASTQRRSR